MMNIEGLDNAIYFDEVSEGQFFVKDEIIYLKIEAIVNKREVEYNAVNARTGVLRFFDDYTTIAKVLKGEYKVNFD